MEKIAEKIEQQPALWAASTASLLTLALAFGFLLLLYGTGAALLALLVLGATVYGTVGVANLL